MERSTRNALQKATQQARKLLEEDFSSQLEGTFDVLRNGAVAPNGGAHLSARQAFQRDKMVAAIWHKHAAGMTAAEAVTDHVRDAAFTTLNRFVALKMLEARELVQECISGGEQSTGYREFCGMAPGVALLPDSAGYRLYIESLFDELSTEVKVLFDRRDPASALWPKRQTFENLLGLLNATELVGIWGEDETIGWAYQFFNGSDERRRMREESQAPRNSRELAVRNQFFTPRYVVQFLTDNTLGCIWRDMQGGASSLVERCVYMVHTEDPAARRLKRDPRDLRVLDPACGSGHFLLYAFDLLLAIYEEAWADPEAARSETTGRTLREDYGEVATLRHAVPALIIEQNLYGVDIDPRAAQIAPLALWMRAQRAFRDFGVRASERARINRTHIVVAEPMPGDAAMVDAFAASLDPPLLRDLFKKMVGEMRLAGELGMLLRVEEGIATELKQAREQFVKQQQATGYLPGMELVRRQGELDLSGIDDAQFFHEAEARLVEALRRFSESATGGAGVRRRLFADDATQGIALIDLMRARFDVVLMNPPFGDSTPSTRDLLEASYPEARLDLYACFVSAALQRMRTEGRVGILSSRLGLFLASLEEWRASTLLGGVGKLEVLADLGHNVLDGALVEAAAYVIGPPREADGDTWACGLLDAEDKECALRQATANHVEYRRQGLIPLARSLPGRPIPYWLPAAVIGHLVSHGRLADAGLQALVGLQTDDDFRFVRLAWEVAPESIGVGRSWRYFAKGGEYSPYYDDIHLVVWWQDEARELRAFIEQRYSWSKNARSVARYGEVGLTYPERTTSEFSPRPLPEGSVFSIAGPAILTRTPTDAFALLSLLYTRWYRLLIEAYIGGGDAVQAGSAARHYKTGIINALPLPSAAKQDWSRLAQIGQQCALTRAAEFSLDETSRVFGGFPLFEGLWEQYAEQLLRRAEDRYTSREELSFEAESTVTRVFALGDAELEYVRNEYGPHPAELQNTHFEGSAAALLETDYAELCRQLVKKRGFARQISKLSHWTDKTYETVAHLQATPVRAVARHRAIEGRLPCWWAEELASNLLSYWCGVAFGRWSSSPHGFAVLDPEYLTRLPAFPPAEQRDPARIQAILVDDEGHPSDFALHVAHAAAAHGCAREILERVVASAGVPSGDLRRYLREEYFRRHIARYSKSRRKAPIYWQLATPSSSYSVWLYASAFTRDTLYNLQNEFAAPKLAHELRRLESLRSEVGAKGAYSGPT